MVGAKLIRISDNVLRSLFDRFNLCRHPETAEQYRNDDKSLFHNGKFYILHHYDALSPKKYYALLTNHNIKYHIVSMLHTHGTDLAEVLDSLLDVLFDDAVIFGDADSFAGEDCGLESG